jgi:peptide/nickel transport system permease protein
MLLKYIGRRLLYSIPGLIGITIIIFLALRILPGDPLAILYGEGGRENLTAADIAEIKRQLGIDRPLYIQYADWMKDVLTGKMGESFWRGDSVSELIIRRGPLTAEIAIIAVLVSWIIGLPVGILGAIKQIVSLTMCPDS